MWPLLSKSYDQYLKLRAFQLLNHLPSTTVGILWFCSETSLGRIVGDSYSNPSFCSNFSIQVLKLHLKFISSISFTTRYPFLIKIRVFSRRLSLNLISRFYSIYPEQIFMHRKLPAFLCTRNIMNACKGLNECFNCFRFEAYTSYHMMGSIGKVFSPGNLPVGFE